MAARARTASEGNGSSLLVASERIVKLFSILSLGGEGVTSCPSTKARAEWKWLVRKHAVLVSDPGKHEIRGVRKQDQSVQHAQSGAWHELQRGQVLPFEAEMQARTIMN